MRWSPKFGQVVKSGFCSLGPAPFSVPVAVRLLWLSTDDLPYSGKLHWGQVTKSAMGPLPIILLSPHLYFLPGILQGQEPTLVQALLPESSDKLPTTLRSGF